MTGRLRRMIVLVLVGWVATGLLASASGSTYAGRPLGDVLRELQATGLNIVFSSEIVRPTMNVLTEPKAVLPRKILDEILRPHGLQVRSGPGGALLVVRLREPRSSPVTGAGQVVLRETPPVTVAGQVVAGVDNAPVAGAAIEAGARRTVTDAAGRFAIDATPGTLRLAVTAKGFVTQRVDLPVVAGMSAIEIVLVVSPEFRETVTVSAVESKEAPASPHVVLAPVAVQRVAGAGDNVFRALQTLPGVSPTDDFSSRLAVRGGGPDQNLTVMDGVEIHNPYRLFGIASAFNPEIVDHFELTAGGFGAKYGDRLSSILLVNNRQGTPTKRLTGSATASFTDANVVLEGKLPGRASGSWLVTGRRTYYDLIAARIVKNEFPYFQDVQAKGVWDPKPGHRLMLFALRSREGADVRDDSTPGDKTNVGFATRNDVAAASYSAPLGARASSRTVAAWYHYNDALGVDASSVDRNTRSNALGSRGNQLSPCGPEDEEFDRDVAVFTRDLNVRDVSVRQEFSVQAGRRHLFETGFDAHALRTGWGWTIDAGTTRAAANGSANGAASPGAVGFGVGVPSLLRSTRNTTRAAVWFQDRYQPRAGVRLEPGVRIDRSGVAGETLASPRLGIRVDLTPRTRLRGAIGRYTQSPGYEKLLQSDYFVDLTSADSGQIKSERSLHVIGAIERSFASSVTGRIEAYVKTFDRLIVGRLETPAETAARTAPYNFPAAIVSSVPAAPIITSTPVNGATGRAYGFDVYVEKPPQSRRDRLSGWASYTWGVADITSYGRQYPFDYDRRHSLSVVGTLWLTARLDLSATLRVASGFPSTPAVGIRVAATPGADGSLVPLTDGKGLYIWSVDLGGVENLNTARLPPYARLDLRVTFNPRNVTGRWQIYAETLNTLDRENASSLNYRLAADSRSDRPRLLSFNDSGFPLLPSFGVRYRF
jgi:TonB-dependent Receptor Plug Domain/Carboxypeptidase regulatory-like domain